MICELLKYCEKEQEKRTERFEIVVLVKLVCNLAHKLNHKYFPSPVVVDVQRYLVVVHEHPGCDVTTAVAGEAVGAVVGADDVAKDAVTTENQVKHHSSKNTKHSLTVGQFLCAQPVLPPSLASSLRVWAWIS